MLVSVATLETAETAPALSTLCRTHFSHLVGLLRDVDRLADIDLFEHSHCHFAGDFEGVIAEAQFDAFGCVFVYTLFDLLDRRAVF